MTREEICNSMTVQDAVRVLKETNCYGTMDIAKTVIIKALEQQPKERTEERTETHECDCISRQAVLEITAETGALETQTRVKALPPVNPQQKMGHWILSGGYWRCSECGEKALLKLDKAKGNCKEYMPVRSKYCPECGSYNGDTKKGESEG